MRNGKSVFVAIACVTLAIGSCDSADNSDSSGGAEGGACGQLCTEGGFDSGTEMDFGDVIECVCTGMGTGVQQMGCTDYCAMHGITEAFLGMDVTANDKCACDGT